MEAEHARQRFAEIATRRDEEIGLAEAALLVAAEEYPALEISDYLTRLDALGREARRALEGARDAASSIERLNRFLYQEQRFGGNRDDYYDTRNSFLNEVLDRRTGIPITLAIVYVEVARRAGLEVHGVGFPGHFLVKSTEGEATIVDPFSGEIVDEAECAARYQRAIGGELPFDRHTLDAATNKQILARVLGNLKQLYLVKHDFERALSYTERILLLLPDAAQELRDRGLLFAKLECWAAALADLRRFLELAPDDDSATTIRSHLVDLEMRIPQLH